MPKIQVDLTNVDWELLRKQKLTLQTVIGIVARSHPGIDADDLSGLLHLLDHLQDQVAEVLGEKAVFGKEFTRCETAAAKPEERSDER